MEGAGKTLYHTNAVHIRLLILLLATVASVQAGTKFKTATRNCWAKDGTFSRVSWKQLSPAPGRQLPGKDAEIT